tara:strand:+ start:537 stop:665 length:129 start_codon:yes stop_codon:yes gene_type:complete
MIKKILLILLCSLALISCGKKGDPEYKESKLKIISPIKLNIQ